MRLCRRSLTKKVVAAVLIFLILVPVLLTSINSWSGSAVVQTRRSAELQGLGRTTSPWTLKVHLPQLPERRLENIVKCTKKKNVLFLKVHKAGSTTLANMFFRFALRHNLNIALPNKAKKSYGFNFLGENGNLTRDMIIPIPPNEEYNILCNHLIYNSTSIQKIMPRDIVKVAIIREPEEQFVSAAYYYQLTKRIQSRGGFTSNQTRFVFSEWLKDPWKFGVSQEVYNSQTADFGMPFPIPNNRSKVEAFLDHTAKDFQLIMLLEYIDESVVLLRRQLCWEMRDVVHIRINVNYRKHSVSFHKEDRERLAKWLNTDFELYKLLSRRFWAELHSQGVDFFLELRHFRHVLKLVEDFCQYESNETVSRGLTIERSDWSDEFVVTKNDCELMLKRELDFQNLLIDRAWNHYNTSLSRKAV